MNEHIDTEITVDPDVPLVRITREFDAPVERLFLAHTDPDLYSRWIGPLNSEVNVHHYDCRSGGSYRYTIERPGFVAGFRGCFHDVRPSELIVQTFTFEGFPDQVALERLVLEDLGGGRSRLNATSLVESFVQRDAFVASGMESGVREGYDKLDVLLSS